MIHKIHERIFKFTEDGQKKVATHKKWVTWFIRNGYK